MIDNINKEEIIDDNKDGNWHRCTEHNGVVIRICDKLNEMVKVINDLQRRVGSDEK